MPNQNEPGSNMHDRDKLEYQEAMAMHRADSALRRQGLAFASGVQVLVIAAFSENVATSSFQSLALAVLACLVCLVGWNQDLRLSKYVSIYEIRMFEIETRNQLRLISLAAREVDQKRFPLSNTFCFGAFFAVATAGWIATILSLLGVVTIPT